MSEYGLEKLVHVETATPPEWVRVYMRKRAQRRAKRNADPRTKLLRKIKLAELQEKLQKLSETL